MSEVLRRTELDCADGQLFVVTHPDMNPVEDSIADFGNPLIIHDGMGKDPRRLSGFIMEAADNGFAPIAVDTRSFYENLDPVNVKNRRFGYQEQKHRRASGDCVDVQSQLDNYVARRRVFGVEKAFNELGLESASLVGFSDGARIMTAFALLNPESIKKFLIVNGACLGNSWHGYKRLIRNNVGEVKDALKGRQNLAKLAFSGSLSTKYALTNRYIIQEKRVVQATSMWGDLDKLQDLGIDVIVMAATEDAFIDTSDVESAAAHRQDMVFTLTDGRHSNFRSHEVVKAGIEQLAA